MTSTEYLALMRTRHPQFADRLWLDRPGSAAVLARLARDHNEFETDHDGGRGESYRESQRDVSVRLEGITGLLTLAVGGRDIARLPDEFVILDVLGGDGTLARAFSLVSTTTDRTPFFTGDIAGQMVARALDLGLPAVRQPAQFLLLHDESVDAVILAYGVHHIPREERALAFREAHRVLKPGGTLVVHDFEEGTAVARWFSEVVDRYTLAGHDYRHFTSDEMAGLLASGGFRQASVRRMYDPFVARAYDAATAQRRLCDYTGNMYGLQRLRDAAGSQPDYLERVGQLIAEYFRYDYARIPEAEDWWRPRLEVTREPGGYRAEMPRLALVGVGVK